MCISLQSRTQEKVIALAASFLNPTTKLLNFVSSEERGRAKSLLKQEMLANMEAVAVKKEPDTEASDTEAEAPQLPELPQLPNLQDLVEMPAKSTPSPESPKQSSPNRIKTRSLKCIHLRARTGWQMSYAVVLSLVIM